MRTSRLKPVRRNDIEALEVRRDDLLRKLATSTTRLRRAQSIHDRLLTQILKTNDQITTLRDTARTVADRINGQGE